MDSRQCLSSRAAKKPCNDYPLYDPRFEHDACGMGFVANISGRREHRMLAYALEALANLAHRGALDADAETSDGAGVLTQLPYRLFAEWLSQRDLSPVGEGDLAAGMIFLPSDPSAAEKARELLRGALETRHIAVLGWRVVPVHMEALGSAAQRSCPRIEQVLVRRDDALSSGQLEDMLFLARKDFDGRIHDAGIEGAYVASLSARTIVYKGLVTAANLPAFYPDLRDDRFETAHALFHQRYSTNTFPSWPLAQPFRMLAHNGEINTIQGNRNRMAAREAALGDRSWGDGLPAVHPLIEPHGSDSASLDNALEVLARSGRTAPHALALLIPEAWEDRDELSPALTAFYQSQAPLMEPWDGPAALVFSDGAVAGAALDRNGLRPLRYVVTEDGLVIAASEVGVVALEETSIVTKGRLGPGQMLLVDPRRGALLDNRALKDELATQGRYSRPATPIIAVPTRDEPCERTYEPASANLLVAQALFGYSHEDVEMILRPMAGESAEAVWSMGDDTPLAVLSRQPRPLSSYFKQRFAQVTNPPIESLREQSVMSLATYLGPRGNALTDLTVPTPLLKLESPLLTEILLASILSAASAARISVATLATSYQPTDTDAESTALARALYALEAAATDAVHAGAGILVLTDREMPRDSAPLPLPLAVSTIHAALVRAGLRPLVGLIAVTGAVWEAHQVALCIGYGANAVCPYLALDTVRALAGSRGMETVTPDTASQRYISAVEKGLLKILARMGLSTLESYLGAQLFECIGLAHDLVERYFPGTPCSLGGLTLTDLDRQTGAHRAEAARLSASDNGLATALLTDAADAARKGVRPRLADRGYVRFRRNAEYHAANPHVVRALQQAARTGDPDDFRRYTELVYSRPPTAIRDLLDLRAGDAMPLDEVEPAENIARRFVTTAMSLGALSPEAHLTLTLGANSIGGRSNTGEGGEEPAWQTGERDGVSTNSRIKQIASGRFGVTAAYVARAEELEIKMAQGSKPGEGGQLPARKVTEIIARLRHTTVGIPLISPPPHHDIYSIEDLAQLIYDLKQVNPRAAVGVKLVAARGVGTIAAGVAKAHADYILISGHDGGTGASPLTAIKNVGIPWEVGLAETQQVLRLNGLRGRVRLRTDGGLKTGRDIVVAALLGADELGFGTAALIALGCDMARQCHLDTCPTGIATQREDLRKRFTGQPEHVATFLLAVAEEARRILASLGARRMDDIIGRTDLLTPRVPTDASDEVTLAPHLDLAPLLAPGDADSPRRYTPAARHEETSTESTKHTEDRRKAADDVGQQQAAPRVDGTTVRRDDGTPDTPLRRFVPSASSVVIRPSFPRGHDEPLPEQKLLDDAAPLLERGGGVLLHERIRNSERTVGARLAGEIARRWGDGGLPRGSITLHYTGSAGQSFGAFCVPGLRLVLTGDANDYVGKGMTGGEIVVMPPPHIQYAPHEQVILGNTVLYGATGGLLMARGQAGERFAVRNSGAVAVVEGAGDHEI